MTEHQIPDFHERVALRAQELWESEGRPDGKADEFWFRGEADIRRQIAGSVAATTITVIPLSTAIIAVVFGIVLGRLAAR